MSRQTYSFALGGGMDEITQPLAINPGRAITCLNHESVENGYGRVDGYERFDGRPGPTDYPFWLLPFNTGVTPLVTGDAVTGATSGAAGIVLLDPTLAEGAWDGTGEGVLGLRAVTGDFQTNESILVGGTMRAVVAGPEIVGAAQSADETEEDAAEAARTYARALIQAIPGSGPVRGVVKFGGAVCGFRDNAGGTAGALYKSSGAGWTLVPLGYRVAFTSGGPTEILEGNTVTGATSGATAVVRRVILQSGDWAGGTAAGYFVVSDIVGTFVAGNLNVGVSTNLATIAAAPVAITLPAGGRYFFEIHNFYGASGTRRVYGANGVGSAFEFDGTYFVPLDTGADIDTPERLAIFRNTLFLSFPNGWFQGSAPGEPTGWEAILGAFGDGIGSDIADFISNVDSLIVLGKNGIFALTGSDSTDFTLSTITDEAGAKPFTGQRLGGGIYLDNRGLRSVQTTQAYGNFAMGAITQTVAKTLKRKVDAGAMAIASVTVRTKNHYRMFFDDGSGLSFYMGRKTPEPMYFDLGKVVECIWSGESNAGVEEMFFGSTDGFVYQLDRGTSFDGATIEGFLGLAYANMGTPNLLKRVHKIGIEAVANGGSLIGLAVEYDYSSNEQLSTSQATVEAQGAGGLWGVANWGEFFWSSPVENVLEAEVEGQGRNASIIVYSNSTRIAQYVLRGATLYYSDRGRVR
jgi:hypothetical protein